MAVRRRGALSEPSPRTSRLLRSLAQPQGACQHTGRRAGHHREAGPLSLVGNPSFTKAGRCSGVKLRRDALSLGLSSPAGGHWCSAPRHRWSIYAPVVEPRAGTAMCRTIDCAHQNGGMRNGGCCSRWTIETLAVAGNQPESRATERPMARIIDPSPRLILAVLAGRSPAVPKTGARREWRRAPLSVSRRGPPCGRAWAGAET